MIEPSLGPDPNTYHAPTSTARKVFRMARYQQDSDRMAGSIPVWESPRASAQHVEGHLTYGVTGPDNSFDSALAYASMEPAAGGNAEPPQEFGFGDLIDMINPLQHIPIVGHLYREATGDDIKPIAQILGGAVFGGPLGAASGLVNAVVREETGKDITGNVMALAQSDEQIEWRNKDTPAVAAPAETIPAFAPTPVEIPTERTPDNPELRLNRAVRDIESAAYQALPPALMGFADRGAMQRSVQSIRAEERPELTQWRARQRYND